MEVQAMVLGDPRMNHNDKRDIDAYGRKLGRVGHYLWHELEKARKYDLPCEIEALWKATKTVWELKKQYREELAQKRIELNAEVRQRFLARGK